MIGSNLRSIFLAFLAVALVGAGGCVRSPTITPGVVVAQPIPVLGQQGYTMYASDTYELRPLDVISISVFREPDLTLNTVPISATGEISMPLLGPLEVTGKTARQLENDLEAMLGARYLRFPDVTVNVVQYGSHQVTVEGYVNSPGVYSFTPGTRLSGAVAMANGPQRIADQDELAVFRQTADGIAVARFDYVAMQSGTMIDPVLEPGDRVVLGLSNLSQYWQDFLLTIAPLGRFTRF